MKLLIMLSILATCYSQICIVDSDLNLDFPNCPNSTNFFIKDVLKTSSGELFFSDDLEERQTVSKGKGNFSCEREGAPNRQCQEECLDYEMTPSVRCSGDEEYCKKGRCRENHHCFCKSVMLVSKNFTTFNGKLTEVTVAGSALVSYIENSPVNRKLLSLYSGEPIYISLSDNTVFVSSVLVNVSGFISMSKQSWNFITPYTGGSFQFSLPNSIFLTSGTLIVSVLIDSVQRETTQFSISGRKICIVSDCIICSDTFSNWSCLHAGQKMFVVICIMLLFCLLIVAFPVVFTLLYWMLVCILYPVKSCMKISRSMWRSKMKKDIVLNVKKLKGFKEYMMSSEEDIEKSVPVEVKKADNTVSVSDWERAFQNQRGPRGNTMRSLAIIMFLSLILSVNGQCTSGVFIPASFQSCTRSGVNETCSTRFSLTTTLQSIGSASCFTVTNSNNASDILLTGSVTFVSMIETFNTAFLYKTGSWVGVQGSRKRCDSAGPCSGNCKSVYPDDITAAGQLSDSTLLNFQGRSICTRGCGCAGCGCFLCSASCIYSRYSIRGSRDQGGVYQITSGVKKPLVFVELKDATGKVVASGYLDKQGLEFPIGPFSIAVVGSLASDVNQYIQNKLIILPVGQAVYYGPANDANAPVAGGVGEVQYIDSAKFINGDGTSGAEHNYMVYDESLASLQTGSTSNSYTFKASSFIKTYNYPQLPALIAGNLWEASVTGCGDLKDCLISVNSKVNTAAPLIVTVETSTDVQFSRVLDLVCPVATYVNTTGCYNCELGAQMNILVSSTCNAGFVVVSSNTSGLAIFTQSISISREDALYTISISVNRGNVDFCLDLSANGGTWSYCGNFVVTAYTPFNTTGPDNNGTKTDNGGSDSGFTGFLKSIGKFFKDIFNGVASWWKYILFIIIIGVVLVAVFFALPFFVRFFRWVSASVRAGVKKIRGKKEPQKKE